MQRDPLPGLGDLGCAQVLNELAAPAEPLVVRSGENPAAQWHLDEVAISNTGRELLEGKRKWFAFDPRERWLGGVRIASGQKNWCWDEARREAVLK